MRVGFDLSQTAHKGGVAVYTNNLAQELSQIKDLEMKFFYSSLRQKYSGNLKNVKKYSLPPTLFEVLFNKIRVVPIEKFIGEIDVFHSSDWIQPPTKAKKVTTYHDVVPLKYPQWSTPKIISVHKNRLKLVEKEIDKVIAVSESTKQDLLEITNVPKEKIIVIYEGVGEEFKPQEQSKVENFRKKYQLPSQFILAIGGVGERRNLKKIKEACGDYNLVITGQTIPYLLDEEMPLLYSAATCLLYPSFYEGFGLPILEAMACGIPVITSNVSSMPEIAGEAALYVNPNDLTEIKKATQEVMEDASLRNKLEKLGLRQAKKFSWEKCAQETAKVYKSV